MYFGEDTNVGDSVFVIQGTAIYLAVIERMTPTTLKINYGKSSSTVNRGNGRVRGDNSRWDRRRVVKDTPVVRAQWEEYRLEAYRASLARKVEAWPWRKCSTEILKQVLELVGE